MSGFSGNILTDVTGTQKLNEKNDDGKRTSRFCKLNCNILFVFTLSELIEQVIHMLVL